MNTEELIQTCRDRNELEFLFLITKRIAETDSIGEGHIYCKEYTKEHFNNAEKHIEAPEYKNRGFKDKYCEYLEFVALPIYRLYLLEVYKKGIKNIHTIT